MIVALYIIFNLQYNVVSVKVQKDRNADPFCILFILLCSLHVVYQPANTYNYLEKNIDHVNG